MSRRSVIPLRVLVTALILLIALTSCKRRINKGAKSSKTNPGNIQAVTLAVPSSGTSVPCYGKVELLVKFATTSMTKPYEPDPTKGGMDLKATFTGPGGAYTVPGFYSGTDWRVRFSPTAVGNWTYTVSYQDPTSKGTWSSGKLTCTASAHAGFARIDGRYLRMSNGSIFYPVGHNIGWLEDVEQPTLVSMAGRGENLLAFWHATPWALAGARAPIENITTGVGSYNQDACTFLDGLVGRAESAGVYLQPTIWSHGELRQLPHKWGNAAGGWWTNNGYSAICATPQDFFVMSSGGAETNQWRLQKNFLRYIFARYGYSRAILNWIAIAEIDGTSAFYTESGGVWTANPAQITAWLQAVRDYWNGMDVYRRNGAGRSALAAFATDWEAIDSSGFFPALGYDPGLDTVSTDSYMRSYSNFLSASVAGIETELLRGPGKPCFHGEFGGKAPVAPGQPQQVSHKGIWAAASAGACMTPLQWTDGSSWVFLTQTPDGDAIRNQLQCLGAFMAGVDCLGDPLVTSEQIVVPSVSELLIQSGWSTHASDRGFGWIQYGGGAPIIATITGLTDGQYQIDWYNVTGTAPVLTSSAVGISIGSSLTVTYPSTVSDLAFKFARTGAFAGPMPIPGAAKSTAFPGSMLPPVEGGAPPEELTDEPPPDSPSGSSSAPESELPPTEPTGSSSSKF